MIWAARSATYSSAETRDAAHTAVALIVAATGAFS